MYAHATTMKPNRCSWLRFSLRTLLIVMLLAGIGSGWLGIKAREASRQRAVIAKIERMGGSVKVRDGFERYSVRFDTNLLDRVEEINFLYDCNSQMSPLLLAVVASHDLDRTRVSDLSPLAELKNVESLNFYETEVSDVSSLAQMKDLQWLSLYGTQVSDLSPLANMKQLEMLDLCGSRVRDISPLAGLESLQHLYLSATGVRDLTPLAKLNKLSILYLSNTQVSDLSPLVNLKELKELHVGWSPVSDGEVAKLQQLLPNCKISNRPARRR